jgi:hypothetical protein
VNFLLGKGKHFGISIHDISVNHGVAKDEALDEYTRDSEASQEP